MRIFQCAALMALLAVSSSQYLPGGGYLPPRKQMSDSALHKFLSAVRGGGRGHREFLTLTGSASSPSYATIPGGAQGPYAGPLPAFGIGIGRLPSSVTHVPAPPKIGAFYITPPERNAPSYYSSTGTGRRPHLLKITELKNARPFSLITAETTNQPGAPQPGPEGPSGLQYYQVNGPISGSSAQNGLPPQTLSGAPGGIPIGPNVGQAPSSASGAGSLQEIIAKAAQQQHAMVLQKEQKAHPNAQITSSQILVPGGGQQPVFLNQFGQPFLAPAIIGSGGQGQQFNGPPEQFSGPPQELRGLPQQLRGPPQQLRGPPQQLNGPSQQLRGPPQFNGVPQILPPHLFGNGQGVMLLQGPPLPPNLRQQQAQPQFNSLTGEIPEQLLKGQTNGQPQQIPIQFLNAAGLQIPQEQAFSFIPAQQGGQIGGQVGGPRGIPLNFRAVPQQFQAGQIVNLPAGILPGNIAIAGLRGSGAHGPLIPGNAVLGQPHFALFGSSDIQGQSQSLLTDIQQQQEQQQQQQQGKSTEKEEQPTRQLESASQQVVSSVSPVPLGTGHGHMTAAIMQSQVEFNEPIVKI